MAAEKTFENKIKKFLESQGCYFVKYFGCAFTRSGVPDLLVCANGKFIAIEVKAENGRLSELQKYNLEQIKKAGGIALTLKPSQFEEFTKFITNLF